MDSGGFGNRKGQVFLAYGDSAGYLLIASPPALSYALDTNQISYDSLVVYEVFGRQVPFSHYNSSSWLAVDPFGMPPYLTPASLRVAVNTAGLEPGTYIDTIFIGQTYDSLPGPSPKVTVPVFLMVGINIIFGDSNGDLKVDIGDVLYIVNYIFRDGAAPEEMAANANCNGTVDVGDAVYIVDNIRRIRGDTIISSPNPRHGIGRVFRPGSALYCKHGHRRRIHS